MHSRILTESVKFGETAAFQSYHFERASRETVQRILGKTDAVDDLEDVPFTADDIKHFAEKKKMAEELDKEFEIYMKDNA